MSNKARYGDKKMNDTTDFVVARIYNYTNTKVVFELLNDLKEKIGTKIVDSDAVFFLNNKKMYVSDYETKLNNEKCSVLFTQEMFDNSQIKITEEGYERDLTLNIIAIRELFEHEKIERQKNTQVYEKAVYEQLKKKFENS